MVQKKRPQESTVFGFAFPFSGCGVHAILDDQNQDQTNSLTKLARDVSVMAGGIYSTWNLLRRCPWCFRPQAVHIVSGDQCIKHRWAKSLVS